MVNFYDKTHSKKKLPQHYKSVLKVTSGNFIEMYDFMIFGFYATAIAKNFFPTENLFSSLMLTFITFGAGFLMRPIGAVILGSYIDAHGRRKGLSLTLGLMAVGTFTIAFTPNYNSIGIFAPLCILLGRLLQGFSAGAELGGVSVYLSEIAPHNKKGLYVSWQSASQQLAVVCTAVIGWILNVYLTNEEINIWGWRIPFLIGCIIIPFLFVIRKSLEETKVFYNQKKHLSMSKIMRLVSNNWILLLLGMLMVATSNVMFYTITAFTPTFGHVVLMMSNKQSFLITLCVGLSNFFWLPIMGHISDSIGRKTVLYLFAFFIVFTAWPMLSWLVKDPTFTHLLETELWLSFLYASYNGAMVIYLVEIIPHKVRISGFSIAYSLSTGLFGGFTPAIANYLIHLTGDKSMAGLWITFAAFCSLIGIFFISKKATEFYINNNKI